MVLEFNSESKVWRNWAYAIVLLIACASVVFFFGRDLHAAPLSVKCTLWTLTFAMGMKFVLHLYQYERSDKAGLGYATFIVVLAAAVISACMYA